MTPTTLLAICLSLAGGLRIPTLPPLRTCPARGPSTAAASRSSGEVVMAVPGWRVAALSAGASTVASTVLGVREYRRRRRAEDTVDVLNATKIDLSSKLMVATDLQRRTASELLDMKQKRATAQAYGERMEEAYEREQDARKRENAAAETEAAEVAAATAAKEAEMRAEIAKEREAKEKLDAEGRALRQSLDELETRSVRRAPHPRLACHPAAPPTPVPPRPWQAAERAALEAEKEALSKKMALQQAEAEQEQRRLQEEGRAIAEQVQQQAEATAAERAELEKQATPCSSSSTTSSTSSTTSSSSSTSSTSSTTSSISSFLLEQVSALSATISKARQLGADSKIRLEMESAGLASRLQSLDGEVAALRDREEQLSQQLEASQEAAEAAQQGLAEEAARLASQLQQLEEGSADERERLEAEVREKAAELEEMRVKGADYGERMEDAYEREQARDPPLPPPRPHVPLRDLICPAWPVSFLGRCRGADESLTVLRRVCSGRAAQGGGQAGEGSEGRGGAGREGGEGGGCGAGGGRGGGGGGGGGGGAAGGSVARVRGGGGGGAAG